MLKDIANGKALPRSRNEALFACWLRTKEGRRVYRKFSSYAKFVAETGYKRYSADAIMHSVRVEDVILGRKATPVNNNYVAYAARLFAERNPRHKNLFAKRAVSRV